MGTPFLRGLSKRVGALALTLVLLAPLSGCADKRAVSGDILTQKATEPGRMPITVLIKHAFSINAFEKAVEEEFPDVDIVQVGNYTKAMSPDELQARMRHDDLTDIIMTWPLDVGREYWPERLIDLSGMGFTSRYNTSMLDTIARDGKLYYLPGPAQVRGIIYNKTLFEENGWEVPKDYQGFLSLCQTIERSGIRSIQLGFEDPEVRDTAFVGYGYADCFAKPQDAQWVVDYEQGRGRFIEHFEPALTTFQEMIDAGIWKKGDLEIDYSEREKMLYSRQCAMTEDSVLIARKGESVTGITDEFALMPFFTPGGQDGDWARLYMVCYIGLNKHLAEPKNKAKYDKVLELMEYISSPEGQEALAGDTGAMYSSLKNVAPPDIAEIKELVATLEHGRVAIFPELKNVQTALREGLAGMVAGELTKDDVAQMVDVANGPAAKPKPPKVLGQASEDFTLMETGNFIADVMRAYSGCEIALFLDGGKDGRTNQKGVAARLYQGDLTENDVRRILPDFKYGEKGELWTVGMSGKDLLETIEYAISVENGITGWFYYFSGLKMRYDPTAEPGNRIQEVSMADGSKIDPERIYSLAIMENTAPEAYFTNCEKTGVLIGDLLAAEIQKKKTIAPSGDGRFTWP